MFKFNNIDDDFLVFGVCLSVLLRWLVSLFPYSGAGRAPMFGDFEAQRHWMEVTYHLPLSDWYYNTTQNDLQYWGLDYPPLTAYHSWMNGFAANRMNSSWIALHTSRGIESYDLKIFMRYTVLVSDLSIYIPAMLLYWKCVCSHLSPRDRAVAIATTLSYPGLYLIDYGHFQYNCISLGLTLFAIVALCRHHHLYSCFFFSLALNYKQMELYHALPFFFYLLGQAWQGKENSVLKVTKLGSVVLLTFFACWYPFLHHLPQVLHRLFPVARGIFEDKVASFWCSLHVIVKFKSMVSPQSLARLSATLTILSIVPSSIHLLVHPNIKTFKYSLVNVSLAFFLFSFHVHEKTILLVAMPVCLLITEEPIASLWFLFVSIFSMFPLLVKDELTLPYFTLFALYFVACYEAYISKCFAATSGRKNRTRWYQRILPHIVSSSVIFMYLTSIVAVAITPPLRYPDLFPVLISLYSFAHFAMFFLYFHYVQYYEVVVGSTIYTKLKVK